MLLNSFSVTLIFNVLLAFASVQEGQEVVDNFAGLGAAFIVCMYDWELFV